VPDVTAEIIQLIDKSTNGAQGAVALTDALDELGLDSLGVVELTFVIEERFDIEIPFNANFDIKAKTVGDLIKSVEALVAAKASAS
jgi:acyl carrier protein